MHMCVGTDVYIKGPLCVIIVDAEQLLCTQMVLCECREFNGSV